MIPFCFQDFGSFSLSLFRILYQVDSISLSLLFGLVGIYPVWDSLGFLDLGDYFLPHFRDVFKYYLLEYFLMVFLFVFFWDSYDLNAEAFNIVSEVSEIVFISLNSFFFFPL